jgi:hypothetical protein
MFRLAQTVLRTMATRTSALPSNIIKSALLGPHLTVDPNSVLSAEQRAQLEKLRVALSLALTPVNAGP